MIFTPEESREIAVKMLKWTPVSFGGETSWLRTQQCDHMLYADGRVLPDFSKPEWTGLMLEVFNREFADSADFYGRSDGSLVVCVYSQGVHGFEGKSTNHNLFDAWKLLRGSKEGK